MTLPDRGITAALGAALLFGASTPLAKLLLAHTNPWLLAALMYLGSGVGLWLLHRLRHAATVHRRASSGVGWVAQRLPVESSDRCF